MPTPAQIQTEVNRLGGDVDRLRVYLQALPKSDYDAWARSPERVNAVGGGFAETVGGPLLALGAGPIGAGVMTAAGVAPTIGSALATGAGTLAGFGTALSGAGGSFGGSGTGTTAGTPKSEAVTALENAFRMSFTPAIRGLIDASAGSGASLADIAAAVEQRLGVTLPDPLSELAGTPAGASEEEVSTLIDELLANGYRPSPNDPNIYFNPLTGDSINIATGRAPGAGGSGAAARTPTYGFTTIGGRVYSTNDMSPTLTDTGIDAPGFSDVQVDDFGNLAGINAQGKYEVIKPGFGYASIDPERSFDEGVRQFDTTEAGLNARNAATERGASERAALAEQGARDRAALNAQVQGFQSINTLAPQLGTLALNNANFTRDVLKEGGDYLARAYFQRGGQSPLPTISQADIINQLRANIGGFQGALSSYQGMGGFAPTTTAPKAPVTETFVDPGRAVVPAPVKVPQPTAQEVLAARTTPGFAQRVEDVRTRVAGAKGGVPGFAEGGHTTEPMMKVGEKGDEIIINPTNAPIAIIPHEDVSDRMRKGAPGFQDGTGLYDFSRFTAPTLPTPAQANQSDLVSLARDTAPPAVTSLAMGNRPDPMRFGFALPTPEGLGDLTNFERDAYKTYLNVVEQTSLEDVEKQVNRQFGRPQGRMGFRMDIK